MELNEDILKRFLAGECGEEEESLILDALHEQPEYFNLYLQDHPLFLESGYDEKLPRDLSDWLFSQIITTISEKKKRNIRILKRLSGVAAIFLVLFGLWKLNVFKKEGGSIPNLPAETKVVKINSSDSVQNWILPDKSMVNANPGAVLTYSKSFNKTKREVFLTGHADFDIVHDGKRPFTVYSNKIATLVLGTHFSVNSTQEKIEVKLFNGKVMVKSIAKKSTKPLYLDPGNAVIYTIATGKFLAISNFNRKNQSQKLKKILTPGEPEEIANKVLVFDNTSMEYAIDKLAEQYQAEIQYSPVDIDGINLIAQITKDQPLKKILEDIALTNGLTVKENAENVFLLERTKSPK